MKITIDMGVLRGEWTKSEDVDHVECLESHDLHIIFPPSLFWFSSQEERKLVAWADLVPGDSKCPWNWTIADGGAEFNSGHAATLAEAQEAVHKALGAITAD